MCFPQGAVDLNRSLDSGMTALHLCLDLQMEAVACALVQRGAIITAARKSDGFTAFHLAAAKGLCGVLRAMLARAPPPPPAVVLDVNLPISSRKTALHLAAANNAIDAVKLLIQSGADVNRTAWDGDTPLMSALRAGSDAAALLLAAHPQNNSFFVPNQRGESALLVAARQAHIDCLGLLLKRSATEAKSAVDYRVIEAVVQRGAVSVLRFVPQSALDAACREKKGNSLLALAACYSHTDMMDHLLRRNAVFSLTREGLELPHLAVRANHVSYVLEWIQKNHRPSSSADSLRYPIRKGSDKGKSLARIAAEAGSRHCLRLLLSACSEPRDLLSDAHGHILFAAAASASSTVEVLELLFDHTPDVNTPLNAEGLTAVHAVALAGRYRLLPVLQRFGVDLLATDKSGRTAFHIAIAQDDADFVKALFARTKLERARWPSDLWTCAVRHGAESVFPLLRAQLSAAPQPLEGKATAPGTSSADELLLEVVQDQDTKTVRQLLFLPEVATNVSARAKGMALHGAIKLQHAEMVKALVEANADPRFVLGASCLLCLLLVFALGPHLCFSLTHRWYERCTPRSGHWNGGSVSLAVLP
jgi:ankyrin repeat protein